MDTRSSKLHRRVQKLLPAAYPTDGTSSRMISTPPKMHRTGIFLSRRSVGTSPRQILLLSVSFVLLAQLFGDVPDIFIHFTGKRTRNFGGISFATASIVENKETEICSGDMSFHDEIAKSKFPRTKKSPSPVKFRFIRRNYRLDFPLKVTIHTERLHLFNSIFVQAHVLESNEPIGKFNTTYSDDDVTIISCGRDPGNFDTVVTEVTKFSVKSEITLFWNPPPNFNKTVVFRINARTTGEPVNEWRGLTSEEILPKTKECVSGDGNEYRGAMSHTKSGLSCQRWDSQVPHKHTLKEKEFAAKGLTGDFCRKLSTDAGPGCFTTSEDVRKEVCDIPQCCNEQNLENFMEFGEVVGDKKLPRSAGEVGRINFTASFPMIKANYESAAVFEDGVVVLGKDSKSLEPIRFKEDGSFSAYSASREVQVTAVIAPFWTNIKRKPTSIGIGYVFFREASGLDVVAPLGYLIDKNLDAKGEKRKENFRPTWAFIATWHLVSDDISITDVSKLNSFQVALTTNGNRSFVLFNYEMKKWSDEDHTALVGYKSGNGFQFLNHSLPYTKLSELEAASSLGRAITVQSNVKRPGQMMYELSRCDQRVGESQSKQCRDSLTLRLKPPKQQNSGESLGRRSDENANACGGSDCGEHGTCDFSKDVCVCNPGFTGAECETNIDECDSNPCQNGANCTDGIDQYSCACRPGYTGTRCEADINDCFNSPCQNGGRCFDLVNGYRCICGSDYTGQNCEKLVDQCASVPCKNRGVCNSTSDDYSCECAEGYSGRQCQFHTCYDGSKCEDGKKCFDKETRTYNCTCQERAPETGFCLEDPPTQPPACSPSKTGDAGTGFISWPRTVDGGIAISSCPTPTASEATRICNSTVWEDPDISACGTLSSRSRELDRLAREIVVAENASDVARQLVNVTSSDREELVAYDISNVAGVLDQIVRVFEAEIDFATGNDVITCVSNLMDAPSQEMRAASLEFSSNSKLIRVVDRVLLKLKVTPGENVFVQSENIKVGISGINPNESFTGRFFTLSSDLQPIISDVAEGSAESASISLPPSIMDSVPPGKLTRLQFATYTSTSLFDHVRTDSETTEKWKISSNFTIYTDYVVSASVGDTRLTSLTDNVTIKISRSNSYFGEGPYCVFYKFPADGGQGTWSSDGCHLRENTTEGVICECDHLTNFAAILDVYGTVEYLDDYQQAILRILTYIGCGLSIFGLLCTLISYTLFEKIRKEPPAKILICLCIALISVNVVYLCLHSAYYSTPTTCVAVAATMHYALLSSLAWMGLEAVNMYIKIVQVFNTYYRRYMLKISLIGWGVPLLIVLAAFVVQFASGLPSYEMNSHTEICWIRREVFYGTLVAPFGLVFLLNTVIYCLVLAQLLGMSSRKLKHLDSARKMRKPAKRENVRKLRGAVGLMALLGISWGFALGTIDKAALTFAYVFVVFNSSQGFWVFIFHCVLKKDVSNSWKKLISSKGKSLRDGSSRWSRFSSSNTRSSRTTSTTSTARSMSSSSTRTSYFVPKQKSVSKSEASIGMDSKGLDVVTRTYSSGYSNPVFDEPDIGDPPPFPPPPIPVSEKRVVRRVPKKINPGPSNTIATQTDLDFLESHDTDSQNSAESGPSSHRLSRASQSNDEEDERRDSVDTNFGSRGGFQHPFHRQVVMSPSNESGIYSDASVSSTSRLVNSSRLGGTDNDDNGASQRGESDLASGTEVASSALVSIANHTEAIGEGTSDFLCSHSKHNVRPAIKGGAPLSDDPRSTDSGISITSASTSDDSPSTSRSQDGRHQLQPQNSRSSLHSNYSNTSSVSAPSSASESATSQNPPSPHLWKAPLVIRRSEDHGKVNFGDRNDQRKPAATSQQGATKRAMWKKHRKHAHSVDETDLSTKDSNVSSTRRKTKKKLPKSQSLEQERTSAIDNDSTIANFGSNQGKFNDGAA